uniref:Uncharacterized protein n=1 Tax=Molossus molossus TaxID=27622 RepID=A0A7J8I8B6_MOLMO|nr:hypothetical protein HJG59_010631 [Molossus molossus]
MRETFQNLISVGKIWENPDIGDQYKNQGRKLRSHLIDKICERKEGNQCGENFGLIPNPSLNKKTLSGVQPWEYSLSSKT